MIENRYYDIRAKNKDGTNDRLLVMNVHEHLVELYVDRSQYEKKDESIIYKQLRKKK